MNKKTFLIIISCVTLVCILAGCFIHFRYSVRTMNSFGRSVSKAVRNGIRGVRNGDYEYDFDDDFDIDIDVDEQEPGAKNFSNTLQSFDSIKINTYVMGVSIERGSRFEISGSYRRDALKPAFNISGGTLNISQPSYRHKLVSSGNCKVVITIPFGVKLENVDINIDVGAVEIKGIDMDEASINTDVGAIAINNVVFNELKANSDVGAVSIELVDPINSYDIDARSDVGAIQVNNASVKRKYVQKGTSEKKIKIKTDVGGIEIK